MRHKIFLGFFVGIVLTLFLWIFFNIDFFKSQIEGLVLVYGLTGIFILSLLADALEQPFGPEVPAVIGISFGLNFSSVFIACISGAFFGGLISFYFGKYFLSKKISYTCSTKKYKNYCGIFSKYGKLSLAVASVSPIPYVTFCWFSGSFGMKVRDFIIFGFIPRIFRIGFIMFFFRLFFLS